jgi:hypothetical protein
LRTLPYPVSHACLQPGAVAYRLFRGGQGAKVRARIAASPPSLRLDAASYYRRRLELLLRGLRAHGAEVTRGFPPVREEGREAYLEALASGRPVALLGLHAGPLELLHRVPPAPAGRPFLILTAPAFAPALSEFLAWGRERDGKRILWAGSRGGPSLETGLRACLERRGVLALMADQYPGPPADCEWIELWDRLRIPYPARLLRFLENRGCLFVPVSARLEAHSARIRYEGPWGTAPKAWIRDFLERAIAAAPDQWNWSYPKAFPLAPSGGIARPDPPS